MSSPGLTASSPNPNAPSFRPLPIRATTFNSANPVYQPRSRATSQPAGEKFHTTSNPNSNPDSGRGSPGLSGGNGNGSGNLGNGTAFGVIGGTRSPARFGNGLLRTGGGTTTRANSFSASEGQRDMRVGLMCQEWN